MREVIDRIVFIIAFLAIVLTVTFLILDAAKAHDFYDLSCCSDKDCKPIRSSEVKATPGGWLVNATGEVLPYQDSKVKESPDGDYHRCAGAANFGPNGRTLCLYVPRMDW